MNARTRRRARRAFERQVEKERRAIAALTGPDAGADRETRVRLCTLHPWCIEVAGHAGGCTLKDGDTLYEPLEHERTRHKP